MNSISPIHRKPQFFHSIKKTSHDLPQAFSEAFNRALRTRAIADIRALERELYELTIPLWEQNPSSKPGYIQKANAFLTNYFSTMKEEQLLDYLKLIKVTEKSLPETRVFFLSQFNPKFQEISPKCKLATYFLNKFVIKLALREPQINVNKRL